jgi:hypothetical protein
VALSLGAILLGVVADRLRRRGLGPEILLGFVAAAFIATQFALILRLPIPSYLLWAVGEDSDYTAIGRLGYPRPPHRHDQSEKSEFSLNGNAGACETRRALMEPA